MAQGIEGGYLAACEIQKGRVNIDETGITVEDLLKREIRYEEKGNGIAECFSGSYNDLISAKTVSNAVARRNNKENMW